MLISLDQPGEHGKTATCSQQQLHEVPAGVGAGIGLARLVRKVRRRLQTEVDLNRHRSSPTTSQATLTHRAFRRKLYIRAFRQPFLSEIALTTSGRVVADEECGKVLADAREVVDGAPPVAGVHPMYLFAQWCQRHDVFMHPSLCVRHDPSAFRDFRFYLGPEAIPRHCPLMAIPEALLIGFKDPVNDEPAIEFREGADGTGGLDDSDIASFFFHSVGLLVSDLLVALHSSKTDARHFFANALHRTRTLHNAPYLEDVVFDRNETCLADVVLQMVKNFVSAGQLSGRVPRPELCWATSVSLSHSTPLAVGSKAPSIGIVPLVHLFPHGGNRTNCVVLATRNQSSAAKIAKRIRSESGVDFGDDCLFVIPFRAVEPYGEAALQPMAPICNFDAAPHVDGEEGGGTGTTTTTTTTNSTTESADTVEAERMWKLSCGSMPKYGYSPSSLAAIQDAVFAALTR